MIVFLEGIIEEKSPAAVTLNVGGVGYEVTIALPTFETLPPLGNRVKLLTYHAVKEDSETLYGFSSQEERIVFLQLLSVSGIGPASALAILSGLPLAALCQAVGSGDVKLISSVKGIGKKTAERLIVELKDKLGGAFSESAGQGRIASQDVTDAILALVALGYKQQEAQEAVNRYASQNSGATSDQIIRAIIQSWSEKK